jgi:flagellar hook-associated protein 2
MSSITSGTGLISGLPINDIVESLMAVQRQPVTLMQNRVTEIGARRTALMQISAQLLSLQSSAGRFATSDFFRTTRASSTQESVMLATAGPTATVGQYTFSIRNLASAHQAISGGFVSSDSTAVGAGVLTIEDARGQVAKSTSLAQLRGGAGIQGGKIKIVDRSGASSTIDLTTAQTIDDVLEAINGQSSVRVRASVSGDRLVLSDQTGLATGTLTVSDVGTGKSAEQLGLAGSSTIGELSGANLATISAATRLDSLNDGNGIRHLRNQPDFSITLADGTALSIELSEHLTGTTRLSALNSGGGVPLGKIKVSNRAEIEKEIDLTGAQTIDDVKTKIESAGLNIAVSYNANKLLLIDSSTGDKSTSVVEVAGGTTAAALGLKSSSSTGTLTGKAVYFVQSVGDVLRLINDHPGNAGKLTASINADGNGIRLEDVSGGAGTLTLTAINGSKSIEDLGLEAAPTGNSLVGHRLLAGLNTVLLRSLNGGTGAAGGVISITDKSGTQSQIDLSGAKSLSDITDAINSASSMVKARVSSSGLGIDLVDSSGGSGHLVIADVSGTLAATLHVAADTAATTISSGNLQKQYVSTTTRLADLHSEASASGVPSGKFRITNSKGQSAVVDLTQGNEQTLQDVIDEINSRGIDVAAQINATGDGILLSDTAGGSTLLKVSEEGGRTAAALGLLGSAEEGQTTIDGSFETRITVGVNDSLQDVLAKINSSDANASATIIRDGSSTKPFRLSLASKRSGREGIMAIDTGTTGLNFDTLLQGRDATVIFGPEGATNPVVLTSATNTLTDAINGVKIDLIAPSETPVTISVSRDTNSVVTEFTNFVKAFNAVVATIDGLTGFDADTETRKVLTGDETARRVLERITSAVNRTRASSGSIFTRLSSVGITLGAGSKLTLNEDKLRAALQDHPQDVETFFADTTNGFGKVLKEQVENLTKSETGLIPARDQALQSSADLLNERIASMEILLDRRRERLMAQFNAMESSIARLQSQQRSLSALGSAGLS